MEFSKQSPAELELPEIPWDKLLDNTADETVRHLFIDKLFYLKAEKVLELLAELLIVRHCNISNGGICNILYNRRLIIIVTGVYKDFTITRRLKIIHCFLPREVGTLLIYYL
ncbi:hypothetical protein BKA59DRAFT_495924 [Fusarium tricinctum]|uniref:Uncharacterized protein n=1 Tax=Fusarium tricinctum TaxID=61284 RepID=A0A8K0RLZ1_9HYPO|nr:hypothetical protein BKA59DRAFT_495924 [Fusarium tricinctum]